ncbi:MAG: glycosyltransferase family 2 protein [Deinococcaceae bacterium]
MKRPSVSAFSLVTAVLGYKLATLAVNLWCFPRIEKRKHVQNNTGDAVIRVSVLIPVRNEAENLRMNLPRILKQDVGGFEVEIIVLDDGSTDISPKVAQQLGKNHPLFKWIKGEPLPAGWVGKNWACHQLYQHARGDLLIFTDADVAWETETLHGLVSELRRTHADLLTVWPRQVTRSWGERLLVPLIDDVLLTLLPYPLVLMPFSLSSAGNGQLMAFRRPAYEAIGGHRGVAHEVLEDVRLARKIKESGCRLRLALGGTLLSVQMYSGYRTSVKGFSKNLRSFHANQDGGLVLSALFYLAAYTLPWIVRPKYWQWLVLMGFLERTLVNIKTGRTDTRDGLEVLLTPTIPIAALPVYILSLRGSTYTWKGRRYKHN